jgi:hypothetical protein
MTNEHAETELPWPHHQADPDPVPIVPLPGGDDLWVVNRPTAWEATRQQDEELRRTYPGGRDEFFAHLWDQPSGADLETFGPLCGVSLRGQSSSFDAPDAGSSPLETVEALRIGAISPQFVSAEVVAGVVRERPRDLWLRGDWEDIVRQHGEWALDLADRVRSVEAHRAANRLRRAIITEDSVVVAPPVNWLVEDMFTAGELAAVIGQRSAGKTTLDAVDLACSVATGTPWLGRRVRRGRVLVIVAEGTQIGYQARVRAWRAAHPDAGDPWANLMPVVERISLVDDPGSSHAGGEEVEQSAGVEEGEQVEDSEPPPAGEPNNEVSEPGNQGEPGGGLSHDAQQAVELATEERPGLVVIDSMAACLDGRPEPSAQDVASVLEAMRAMAEAAGSTVVIVHHGDRGADPAATLLEEGVGAVAYLKSRRNSSERFVECIKPSHSCTEWQTVKLRLVSKGDAAVLMPTPASDTDAIHRALADLGAPAGKSAILEQARGMGFGLNRNRALRLVDELADDPDDLVAKDGIKYFLEGSLDW